MATDDNPRRIAGILLAAGAGSRFGGQKLLHPLPDGTPVGVQSIRNLRAALGQVTAVVRQGDDELGEVLSREAARVLVSTKAHLGMGHSLAYAIEHTATQIGWVVALGDMPMLRPATIVAVAEALARTGAIVVPMYRGDRGHPVGFPVRLRDQLVNLTGDEGARALLRHDAGEVIRIEVDDPGTVRDVDTRQDIETMGRQGPAATA